MGRIQVSEWFLAGLVFFYCLNLGPMLFESFTSDRIWASNPPDSFYMFLGQYGQKTAHYWRVVSPLALLSFIVSIALNWYAPDRRSWLFIAFALYLAVQMSTMAYFVPEQERLVTEAGSLGRELLKSRADRWIFLNYFRMLAGVLAFACVMRALVVPRVP